MESEPVLSYWGAPHGANADLSRPLSRQAGALIRIWHDCLLRAVSSLMRDHIDPDLRSGSCRFNFSACVACSTVISYYLHIISCTDVQQSLHNQQKTLIIYIILQSQSNLNILKYDVGTQAFMIP